MEELSKKDILTLIGENITTIRHAGYKGFDEGVDLEEMPQKPEDWPKLGAPDPTKPTKRSKGVVPKWTRLYETNEDGKIIDHVGWYLFDHATETATPIIFTCEWDELVAKHPDLVPKLKEKFGEVKMVEKECPPYDTGLTRANKGRLVIKPLPGEDAEVITIDGEPDIPSEDKTTYTREKINRRFRQILKTELEQDTEFTNGLKKFSLPEIVISHKKHRNNYSDVNNEAITFQTHNINLYSTQKEFVKHVMHNLKQRDPDNFITKERNHFRRLYNKVYSNWQKLRFTASSGYGKTPVFGLDKGDFPNEEKFEVLVSSDVKIEGKATEKNDNGEITKWVWTANYTAEYAKKPEMERIAKKLVQDVSIDKVVEVELSEPKKFDGFTDTTETGKIESNSDKGDNHPLTDVNIVKGLEQVLSDFKEEITNVKQKASTIKRAISKIEDLGGERALRRPQLNEDEIRKLVKKTIKENK